MKKFLKLFIALLGIALALTPVKNVVAQVTGLNDVASAGIAIALFIIVLAVSASVKIPGLRRNGVEVEIWVNYIIERLWKDNQFLRHAFSDDDKVVAGKIVHIPQPGAMPTVVKGRSVFPAAAVRRTDTDILYPLEEYSTDPTHIQDAEKVELSYDKIDSVYGDHAGVIVETVGDDMILKWLTGLTAASMIRTSGAATPATLEGTTGTRKAFTEADLRRSALVLNKQKVGKTDRYALLTEDMEDQLKQSLTVTQARDYSTNYDAVNGVVGRLHGFNIMTRASVAVATSALGIKALGAAVAATDHEVSFVWQKNAVARALGEVKFFEKLNDPQYYGDVYSSLLRAGGRRRREDNKGIIAIVQDNG